MNKLLIGSIMILVYGCGNNATETNAVSSLEGLYEGVPTYEGAGYTPDDRIEYFRFKSNGDFSWIGLELIEPNQNSFPKGIDTSLKYAQFYTTTGHQITTDTSVCYSNLSTLEATYGTNDRAPYASKDYCVKIKLISSNQFATQIVGGGSGPNGSFEYYMTYTKIGNTDDSIKMRYLKPVNP